MKRDKFIGLKVSDYENNLIRIKAKNSKMTVSNYVRKSSLENDITVINGLENTLPEIRRIGNNINQITAILHSRDTFIPDFLQIKLDFGKLVHQIEYTLKGA